MRGDWSPIGALPARVRMRDDVVGFGTTDDLNADYDAFIRAVITEGGVTSACEVGAGANPMVDDTFRAEHDLRYAVLDVSASELAKAPGDVTTVLADICDPAFVPEQRYELVFSRMLAEHVPDAAAFHTNCHRLLVDDGWAIHFFPTLYALPFVANRAMPEWLSARVLRAIDPRRTDDGRLGKFPARYEWCRGPTGRTIARLEACGYEVRAYIGFFGHGSYYRFLPPLARAHARRSRYRVARPTPLTTTYAWVAMRRHGRPAR